MIKLSVCIPTYNRADLLRVTLDALLSQLEGGMEIVISDNASTDGTEAMIESYRRKYPSIVYHRWPENMGADRNYLRVVELAQGEYCWLFGSDDTPVPGAMRAITEMLDDHSDIYLFNRNECTFEMEHLQREFLLDKKVGTRVYRFGNPAEIDDYLRQARQLCALFSYLSSIVVRREAWCSIKYDERYTGSAYSHAFILLSLVRAGCSLHYDPRQLVNARMGNDSFLAGGLAGRIRLDFDGYGAIRDQVFANDPRIQARIDAILVSIHSWYALARYRIEMPPPEWEEILQTLHQFKCPWGKLLAVRAMSHFQFFLRGYIWAKLCIARGKIKRW